MDPVQPVASPPKRRGCFFYGCLISLLLCVFVAAGLFFGTRYALKTIVANYTSPTPIELPQIEVTPELLESATNKYGSFSEALETNGARGNPVLVLDEREINTLIQKHPDFQKMNGKIYVSLAEDQMKGQLSWPLADLGFKDLNDRYFNGSASFRVSLQNGQVVLNLQDAEVKGKPLPESATAQMRTKNLLEDIDKDPEVKKQVGKLERIEIKDGRLVIEAKSPGRM